jgi:HAD superfamily hydrolase (TIGR01509 family)
VSNGFLGARAREQAAYGLEDRCDTIVYSHEVGYVKPDPRIFEIALERLDVSAVRTVFLDDVQRNVDGALAVGIDTILFVDTEQAIGELRTRLQGGRG